MDAAGIALILSTAGALLLAVPPLAPVVAPLWDALSERRAFRSAHKIHVGASRDLRRDGGIVILTFGPEGRDLTCMPWSSRLPEDQERDLVDKVLCFDEDEGGGRFCEIRVTHL